MNRKEYQTNLAKYMVGALTLAPALAWNDAIKTVFETYVTIFDKKGIPGKMLYATFISIVVIFMLSFINPSRNDKK